MKLFRAHNGSLAACVFSSLGFLSCNTTAAKHASNLKAGGTRPKILLIDSGGWNSCKDGGPDIQRTASSLLNLANDLSANADVDYLVNCLGILPPAKLVARTDFSYKRIWPQISSTRTHDFPALIDQYIADTKPDQVYAIGHSYGGWVSLNLLEDGQSFIDAVFTLDPIDARDCLIIDNIVGGTSDCVRPPNMNYDSFSHRTHRIINLWQPLGNIHSTAIQSSVVVNQQLDVDHPSFNGDQAKKEEAAHRMIGADPVAWGVICQTIFNRNNWSPSGCTSITTDDKGLKTGFQTVSIPQVNTNLPAPQQKNGGGRNNNNNYGNNGSGQTSGGVCGDASPRTKVCINQDRTIVTITNNGNSSKYQVQAQSPSRNILPGGLGYQGVADLSFIQGFSRRGTNVTFIIDDDNGIGDLAYFDGGGWNQLGDPGSFPLQNTGGTNPNPNPSPNPPTGSGKLCGQATANSKVCLDTSRSKLTLSNSGMQETCSVKATVSATGDTQYTCAIGLNFLIDFRGSSALLLLVGANEDKGRLFKDFRGSWAPFTSTSGTFSMKIE